MINRRSFLKASSAALAGWAVPGTFQAINAPRFAGANDRVNVALIGCRNMGWGNFLEFLRVPGVNPVALCDVDSEVLQGRSADLTKLTGKKATLYSDYRKLLESRDVDAVVIGTPDHWHCLMATDSCSAGKDVYVEKPLANSIAECDAMVASAVRHNRVVQVGQQQRSGLIWHEMKNYIDTGRLGKISKVKVWANFSYAVIKDFAKDSVAPSTIDFDMWLGPAPLRSFNASRFHGIWRMFWDYGGGLVTDWGVHLLDMALWGMNTTTLPKRVLASGGNFAYAGNYAETFDTLSVVWEYPDFIIEWSNTAGAEVGPYGKNYGLEFCGANGSLVANREGWEVVPADPKSLEATTFSPDEKDRYNHVANFIDCVRQHKMDTACTIQNGSLCAKFAHMGNIAARTHASLVYDDAKHTFNHPEADRLVKPEYRRPWVFPEF